MLLRYPQAFCASPLQQDGQALDIQDSTVARLRRTNVTSAAGRATLPASLKPRLYGSKGEAASLRVNSFLVSIRIFLKTRALRGNMPLPHTF